MISEFGSKLPFGFLVGDSKRVIRISGFSGIPPGLVSIISGFLCQLMLISQTVVRAGSKGEAGLKGSLE